MFVDRAHRHHEFTQPRDTHCHVQALGSGWSLRALKEIKEIGHALESLARKEEKKIAFY